MMPQRRRVWAGRCRDVMRRVVKGIVFGAPFVASGCGNVASDNPAAFDGDTTTVSLATYESGYDSLPSEVYSEERIFEDLMDLSVDDSFVIAVDRKGDPFIYFLERESGRVVGTYGRRGNGPGEFRNFPFPIVGSTSESGTWFADVDAQRITYLSTPTRGARAHVASESIRSRNLEPAGVSGIAAHRSGFLASRVGLSGRLEVISYDTMGVGGGTVLLPPLVDDRAPPEKIASAYFFQMCVSPDGDHMGLSYVSAGRVEILDLVSKELAKARVPFEFRPTLTEHPGNGQLVWMGQGRRGYGKCLATREYLYTLFRGTLQGAFNYSEPSKALASHIHVFDWTGALVRVIKLDHFAGSIALDPGGRWLYSIAAGNEAFNVIRRTFVGNSR